MAGAGDNNQEVEAGTGDEAGKEPSGESLAARRRRIEMMRERQELMAMLDDFGDGDLDDIDLELLDEDDAEVGRWVSAEDGAFDDEDESSEDLDDEDDDYYDDDFEDED